MNTSRLPGWLSIGLGVVMVAAFTALSFWAVLVFMPERSPQDQAGSILVTVFPAPTLTPVITVVNPAEQTPQAPTLPPPGEMGVGVYVQIYDTGGDGLRLRAEPGRAGNPLFIGMDSEVFLVKDGPREADNYTWWLLEAPYDKKRSGWAVQDYLRVIENP